MNRFVRIRRPAPHLQGREPLQSHETATFSRPQYRPRAFFYSILYFTRDFTVYIHGRNQSASEASYGTSPQRPHSRGPSSAIALCQTACAPPCWPRDVRPSQPRTADYSCMACLGGSGQRRRDVAWNERWGQARVPCARGEVRADGDGQAGVGHRCSYYVRALTT